MTERCSECGALGGEHHPKCSQITFEQAKTQLALYFDAFQRLKNYESHWESIFSSQADRLVEKAEEKTTFWQGKFHIVKAENNALRKQLFDLKHYKSEIERLRRDCGEAYHILGCVLDIPRAAELFSRNIHPEDERRALDNLLAAYNGSPRPHNDLLPWPKEKTSNR